MELFNVIKFDGFPNKDWILFKFPGDDFFDQSTLIVGVGQIAIIVHGGKIEHIFKSGTYKLSTENYPFLRGLIKSVHGGRVPFSLDIYYFNATVSLKNVWGTQSPIQMIDPKYNVKVRVRANGQYALQLNDVQSFFSKLIGSIGTKAVYGFNDVNEMFRGIINSKISIILGEYIIKQKISFLDITLYLEEISEYGKTKITDEFAKYGLEVINFYFATISVPEEDLARINDFLNKRAEFDIMGDERYRVSRSFDVLEKAASNGNGAGALASAGIGLGLGIGMAPTAREIAGVATIETNDYCRNCKRPIAKDAIFCPYCGTQKQRKCPNCAKDIEGDISFCPYCGTKLS